VLHGNRTYLLMDADGQIQDAHSISAGLDYPGVGPEHSYWKDAGRVRYTAVTDDGALAAFQQCCKAEGIIPALETAHAIAEALRVAAEMPRDQNVVVCLSGRGDKDVDEAARLISAQAMGNGPRLPVDSPLPRGVD
jgi:tryptophan synthase beta chain